jgi:tetratricopeptide (TPR) repeat protein
MWALLLLFLAQSSSYEAAFRAGLEALQRGEIAQARTQLESAAKMEPARAQVWLALAQTYWKLNKAELAATSAQKAGQLAPDDPVILRGLVLFYSENGDYKRAADTQIHVASQAPAEPGAYERAIQFYLQAKEPKLAIDAAQKALAKEDRAALRKLLGEAYEMDGRPDEAFREMREAIRLNPYDESAYFELGRDLLAHNRMQDTIQVLDDGKKVFAKSAQLELTLGVAYYGMRRFPDAVNAFLRTIQIDPKVDQPYVFLGRMLEQTEGKLPEVTAAFAELVKSNPKNYLGNFLYGKALAFSGQAQPAEILLRKSVGENEKYWESHFELGAVLERKRAFPAAALEFGRAAELNPKSPSVHYRLARVYDRLGKADQAKAEHALHEKLTQEENAFLRRQAGGMGKLE